MSESEQKAAQEVPGRMKQVLLRVGGGVAILFVGIQFVPVEKLDIPNTKTAWNEPAEVTEILKRACFDCHSNEIRTPWYTHVAPVSWLLTKDIIEGRDAFNFSEWDEDEDDRQFNRESAWEQVEEGEMPPAIYVYPMHMDAKLSAKDVAILKKWGAEKDE